MKRIVLLIILLSFDAFAFVRGLHPCVSEAYRDYYLRHSITIDAYLKAARAGQAEPGQCNRK